MMNHIESRKNKAFLSIKTLTTVFVCVLLLELVIGGGGRLVEVGPVTARMILFLISIVISISIIIVHRAVSREVMFVILSFTILQCYSVIVGVSAGNDLAGILNDLKPMLFFYLIVFFDLYRFVVLDNVFSIIRFGAVFMATCYLLVITLMNLGIIPFEVIYLINETGEFFFREEKGFVYKGYLFVVLGALYYFINGKGWKDVLIFLFLCTSIYFVYARGFIVSIAICILMFYLIDKRLKSKLKLVFLLLLLPVLIVFYLSFFQDRVSSDASRLDDIFFLLEHFNSMKAIFIGEGYGGLINGREKIEYSLFEILYKSGVLGLTFWLGLYSIIALRFMGSLKNSQDITMFVLVSCVYIQSFFNPYLNNPIGMSFVLISFIYFKGKESSVN
jgi:hypothetical protein